MDRFNIRVRGKGEIQQLQTTLAMQARPEDVVQIGLIAVERDPDGEWVRYADVARDAPLTPTGLLALQAAERERDAAREAQQHDNHRMQTAQRLLGEANEKRVGAEAELRTARAEMERLQGRLAVHDRLAASVMAYMRGEGVTLVAAAPPDAGWCYDMAAAPRPGAPQNDIMLAFPGQKVRCGYRRIGETVWREPTSGERLNDCYGEPYAWRRAPAPPRPEAHQVPPVGSKL